MQSATGLYIARFFLGILGATFVPCQVWCTGFFDKSIVGTANAISGGWGNAGGGITYFIMPAVFDALVTQHHMTPSKAWRVTFIVPLVCIMACAAGMAFLCEDSPLGRWSEREERIQENLRNHSLGGSTDKGIMTPEGAHVASVAPADVYSSSDEEKGKDSNAISVSQQNATDIAQGETVVKPRLKDSLGVIFSPQTLFHMATYGVSFGAELAVNSVLSSYYKLNFPGLSQSQASNYAAIFGFINFITRPLGGFVADLLYTRFGRRLWLKKGWITLCGLLTGMLLIVIGREDPSAAHGKSVGTIVGMVAVMAIFLEAGNGANFALVPHVHPSANGIVSGVTGAGGNLGGLVFAIIFRFMDHGKGYAQAFWIIGIISIVLNLAVCWIPPLPKGQIGGR